MPVLYFTKNEIFNKFNILLYNIDKVSFKSESETDLSVKLIRVSTCAFEFKIKKHNGKIYREIFGEHDDDLKLKLAVSKFLELLENKFDQIMNLTKVLNFEVNFNNDEPDYCSGSKARIKVTKQLYIDLNTACDENCLLFLDSEFDIDYGYYTILDIDTGKIKHSSILDVNVMNAFDKNSQQFKKLSIKQNELKQSMTWN